MRQIRFFILSLAFATAAAGEAPAQRIVTLAPHLTELVYAVGAQDKLVAVSSFSDYPAEAGRLPMVANGGKVNVEAVMAMKPDLILAWRSGNHAADVAELQRRGYRVWIGEARTLAEVAQSLRDIGRVSGEAAGGQRAAAAFEARIAGLRERYAARPKLSVFVEIWQMPLMTVNGEHVINEVLRLCGAANVFADAAILAPAVSLEQLYARQPEVLLSTVHADPAAMRADWARHRRLRAVQNERLYAVSASHLTRMGPRLADGAAEVCEALERARP